MPLDPIAEARRQWIAHGWSGAADGMAMVTSVQRVQQLLMERIDAALKPHGLTFARFEVLRLLAFTRSGALPMTKLGSLLQVHPTSVTNAVVRLESQGYVDRTRSEGDRRVVLATITRAGRAAAEEATTALNAVFEHPGLPADEVQDLTVALTALRRGLGDRLQETRE